MTVGLAIVAMAVVYFMIVSPGFRKTIGVIFLAAVGLLLWYLNHLDETSRQVYLQGAEAERFQTTAIRLDDLSLTDVSIKRPSYANADGGPLDEWIIEGTVTNNSKFALGGLTFEIMVVDCQVLSNTGGKDASRKNCRTVGQQTQSAEAHVPPGQTRAFSSYALKFEGMPRVDQRFYRRFSWTIGEVRAGP
jgi:hypothetical protein